MDELGLHLLPKGIGPKRYLDELFAHTENGVLTIARQGLYYEYPLVTRYSMSWTEADVPVLYKEYQTLRDSLRKISETIRKPDSKRYLSAVKNLLPEGGKLRQSAEHLCFALKFCQEEDKQRECCEFIEELALAWYGTGRQRIRQEGEYWVELEFLQRTTFERWGDEQPCSILRTTGPHGYQVNVFDVGYDPEVKKGDICAFRLVGHGFTGMKAYPSEEALRADGCDLPVPFVRAMSTPVGSFPDEDEEAANPYPGIEMTGKVLAILWGPKELQNDLLAYTVLVETAEMTFELNIDEHAGELHVGDILYGCVSLDGMVEKA